MSDDADTVGRELMEAQRRQDTRIVGCDMCGRDCPYFVQVGFKGRCEKVKRAIKYTKSGPCPFGEEFPDQKSLDDF